MGGVAVGAFAVPANAASVSTWDALAQCESGGNWGTNTGNGFSGGLQFTPSTWAAFGGTGSPQGASKGEQIRVAEKVLQGQGWGAWPACSAKLGLSGNGGGVASAASVSTQASSVKQAAPVQQAAAAPVQQAAPVKQAAPVAQAAPVQQAAPVAQAPAVTYSAPAAPVQQAAPAAGTYTVQAGDTLGTIANKLGVNGGWQALFAANSGTVADANLIFPGQVLNIPA